MFTLRAAASDASAQRSTLAHSGCEAFTTIPRGRMNYSVLLYAPIYQTFGVQAELTPSRPDAAPLALTIIERTKSADASEEFELGTLRPGAFVRRRELDQAGIAPAELDGGALVLGGRTWRIDTHASRPGPDGEASGEILMFLTDA